MLQKGWFSDRSACYLSSGRPLMVEGREFTEHSPVGEGLHTFNEILEARAGVTEIHEDYAWHACAARSVAEKFFHSRGVLKKM